jgi:hypothetical protein
MSMEDCYHSIEDSLHGIRELLVQMYPEAVRIDVAVTAGEITATPIYKTDLSEYTMQNVSGKWVKKESENG